KGQTGGEPRRTGGIHNTAGQPRADRLSAPPRGAGGGKKPGGENCCCSTAHLERNVYCLRPHGEGRVVVKSSSADARRRKGHPKAEQCDYGGSVDAEGGAEEWNYLLGG